MADTVKPNKKFKFNPILAFSSLKSRFKLSDGQKSILAGVFAFASVLAILFGYFWYTDPSFKYRFISQKNSGESSSSLSPADAQLAQTLKELSDTLTKVAPEDYIYQTINFEDLPVYPNAWVEKYFSSNERANALISGPSADPDNDGLSNKQEYLMASDPKNPDTLCNGKKDKPGCTGKNDKQNVDEGISPLTGEVIQVFSKLSIKRQDFKVLTQVQDSFDTAYREGVDFPSLYQLSAFIDLSPEFNAIKVQAVDDERNAIIDYLQVRIDVLQEFVDDSAITSFSKIYQINKASDLDKAADRYYAIRDKLYSSKVPKKYEGVHKAYIMLFQKLAALVLQRKGGLDVKNITDQFKADSKQKGIEVLWVYRRLNVELSKIPSFDS